MKELATHIELVRELRLDENIRPHGEEPLVSIAIGAVLAFSLFGVLVAGTYLFDKLAGP